MPDLLIRLTKRSSQDYVLTCIRADGSLTRKHYRGATAWFFPQHDLIHYAVESVLGHRRGFYGLVLEGWSLMDFGSPWPRGRPTGKLDPSEILVGMFTREMTEKCRWTREEIYAQLTQFAAQETPATEVAPPSEDQLQRVRGKIGELLERWNALPVGETMDVEYFSPIAVETVK